MIRNLATMVESYIGTWRLGTSKFYKIVTRPQLDRYGHYVCDVMIYDSNYSFVEYWKRAVINELREAETKKEMIQTMFCECFNSKESLISK